MVFCLAGTPPRGCSRCAALVLGKGPSEALWGLRCPEPSRGPGGYRGGRSEAPHLPPGGELWGGALRGRYSSRVFAPQMARWLVTTRHLCHGGTQGGATPSRAGRIYRVLHATIAHSTGYSTPLAICATGVALTWSA